MGSLISAAGDIMGGIAGQGAANAQSQIAKDNAKVAARNADLTMQAGEQAAFNVGLKNRAQMGAIKASQASSGVDVASGSSKDVQDSQRALGLFDTMNVRSNAAREAFGYKVKENELKNEAVLARNKGTAAMIAGGLGGIKSLAGGMSGHIGRSAAIKDAGGDQSGMSALLAF